MEEGNRRLGRAIRATPYSIGPSRVSGVLFDKTSRYLIYHSGKGACAQEIDGDKTLGLSLLRGLAEASFDPAHNSVLIPIRRKGAIARVAFEPLSCETITVPVAAMIYWIRHSPSHETCFLIDSKKNVHCYTNSLSKMLWRTSLDEYAYGEHIYVGAYAGNGELIGITVTLSCEPHWRTIVLRADDGAVVRVVPGIACDGYPLADSRVLLETGQVLDLATGQVSDSILPESAQVT